MKNANLARVAAQVAVTRIAARRALYGVRQPAFYRGKAVGARVVHDTGLPMRLPAQEFTKKRRKSATR